MNTLHTPALTIPELSRPTLDLQVFSDADAQTRFVQDMGRGPEKLVNTVLALGTEAAVLQGRHPRDVEGAIAAGHLCIGVAVYGNDTAAGGTEPAEAPGIYRKDTDDIELDDTDWHALLTIHKDNLEISTGGSGPVRGSASFTRGHGGIYQPRQLAHAKTYYSGPYAERLEAVTLRERTPYTALLSNDDNRPARLRKRLEALTLLGSTATTYNELLSRRRGVFHVAVEGKNL